MCAGVVLKFHHGSRRIFARGLRAWWRWLVRFSVGLVCVACSDSLVLVGDLDGHRARVSSADGAMPLTGSDDRAQVSEPSGATSTFERDAGDGRAAEPMATTGSVHIETGSHDAFCQGQGPALHERSDDASRCGARLMRKLFSYALCACDELRIEGDSFVLDSFDSRAGVYRAGETGAAVGSNGPLSALATDTQLLGSVLLASDEPLVLSKRVIVAGDLKTNGTLDTSGSELAVGRDLWVGGDIRTSGGSITVARDVYQTARRIGVGDVQLGGRTFASTDFRVEPPCACGDGDRIDVAALVAQARAMNDNEAVGWSPDPLALIGAGTSEAHSLPCGRLFLSETVVLNLSTFGAFATGRSALFIDGDFTVASLATVHLGVLSGELDVFIRGNLSVESNSTLLFGDTARPAATRVFIGGEVTARGMIVLGAQLYAPNATIDVTPVARDLGAEAYGAVFARDIRGLGAGRVHYDRAILDAEPACSAPAPQRCDGCHECPGDLACVHGECAACATDADCCAPNVCANGSCLPLVTSWP